MILIAANQSAMFPAGRQSELIGELWWLYVSVTAAVYIVVMLVVLAVAGRSRRHRQRAANDAPTISDPPREGWLTKVIAGSVALTTIILFVLMISDFLTGRRYHALSAEGDIHLKVTARQWWWEFQYVDAANPSNSVTTANEITLPAGKTVRVDLESRDVIHSFWLPNLAGKKDAIPGHPTALWIKPEQIGKFEGQCAEFCGLSHAKMRMSVTVTTQDAYNKWYQNQLADAQQPQTDMQKRGREVLLSSTCVMCHTVQGTPARGMVGPSLTHVGSKQTLAAGSLPNMPGHLAGWILDPQKIKPGVRMPQHSLSPEDLRDLLAYLESLK